MTEMKASLEDIIAENDKVVARISYKGVMDGKPFTGEVVDVWRVENNKLAEHWTTGPVFEW